LELYLRTPTCLAGVVLSQGQEQIYLYLTCQPTTYATFGFDFKDEADEQEIWGKELCIEDLCLELLVSLVFAVGLMEFLNVRMCDESQRIKAAEIFLCSIPFTSVSMAEIRLHSSCMQQPYVLQIVTNTYETYANSILQGNQIYMLLQGR